MVVAKRINEKEYQAVKQSILDLVEQGYSDNVYGFCGVLNYDNDTIVAAALAELEYEGKAARLGSKQIPDSEEGREGYPIIIGYYGPAQK